MTKKISQLTQLTVPDDTDVIVVNDTSTGITKRMTRSDFLGGVTPPGAVVAYIANAAPTGWLLCNGQAVSRSTYNALFAFIGTAFGGGDGSTTFNVPDLRGRIPVGKNSGTFSSLAGTGGEETHVLTLGELAVHSHTVSDPGHAHGVSDPGHAHGTAGNYFLDAGGAGNLGLNTPGNRFAQGLSNVQVFGAGTGIGVQGSGTGISVANAGSGSGHNNLQPYLVLNYIIKT